MLVTGGRYYRDREAVYKALDAQQGVYSMQTAAISYPHRLVLITGGAGGADSLAADWAHANGVHLVEMHAVWDRFGRAAGPIRNAAMLQLLPDVVLAFPGGKGAADMVRRAKDAGVRVIECS